MKMLTVPKLQTKYGWLCTLFEWTNSTRHDLITRNIWPKPETSNNQEFNTMPMNEKQWGTDTTSWAIPKIQQMQNNGLTHRPKKQPRD
jgi:hypothetical protein